MEEAHRKLQQEDSGQDVPSATRVHVSQSREGREPSEVCDRALGGEAGEDDGGTWSTREDPRLVATVGVDGDMSQECDQWNAKGQCPKEDACSFRHDDSRRGKKPQSYSTALRSQAQDDGRRPSKGSATRGIRPSGRKYQKLARRYSEV